MMDADLLSRLLGASASGAIPNPLPSEEMDAYKLRVATAGAVVGAQWADQRRAAANNAAPPTERHSDVPVTSPVSLSQRRSSLNGAATRGDDDDLADLVGVD